MVSLQLNKIKASELHREYINAEINAANITENNSVKGQHRLPGVRGSLAELLPL